MPSSVADPHPTAEIRGDKTPIVKKGKLVFNAI